MIKPVIKPVIKGAYARINLDNIIHNYLEVCKRTLNKTLVSCVVKSDAYGHGEKQVTQALIENGLRIICVSTLIEAVRMRQHFPNLDILILGYTPQFLLPKVSEYNLIQTISTLEEANHLNQIGPVKVHLKINTGMNRLGFDWQDAEGILQVCALEHLHITGIFSHLHSSDHKDKRSAEEQFLRFNTLIQHLESHQIALGTKHICNSGGIIDLQHMHLDMVREGIMLYGLYPSANVNHQDVQLKEAMSLRSYIASIHDVQPGEGISYGHTYLSDKPMKVATINLGYSDGVFRALSNKGQVIIKDQLRPIIGTVCMNMFMVDVTDVKGVAVEDEVIIFGESESCVIPIDEVAKQVGTISYEITCRTGYSVPRVFIKNSTIIEVENPYLIEQ